MEISERLGHDYTKLSGAVAMISKPGEFIRKPCRFGFIARVHECVCKTLQLLAAFPEAHGPLVVAAHRLEAQ